MFCRGYEVKPWSRFCSYVWSRFWIMRFLADALSRFWRWNVIKICYMTSRSYFGKMNSTLGSVVPLAMFSKRKVIFNIIESLILSSVCCCSLTNWLERCITEASRTWKMILCFWDPLQWDKFFFEYQRVIFHWTASEKCHWPVNDSFDGSPKSCFRDFYKLSLTGQWQFLSSLWKVSLTGQWQFWSVSKKLL